MVFLEARYIGSLKMDWINLLPQKKSRMDDQEAEGSHINKKYQQISALEPVLSSRTH